MEANWTETELRRTKLKDRRRVNSFIRAVTAIYHQPQLSLSAALGPATRQAAGDLFKHMDIRVADLLSGHVASTVERCQQQERVIVSQDTTYFTYGQEQIVGLGPLNGTAKGMVGHGALALSPAGVPLGVLTLRLWGDTAHEIPDCPVQIEPEVVRCESAKWEVTLASVQAALPEGAPVLVVADRESDVTSYLRAPRRPGVDLLIRAVGGRRVQGAAGEVGQLQTNRGELAAVAAAAPALGWHTVAAPARPAQPGRPAQKARTATVELRLAAVELPGRRATRRRPAQPAVALWVIQAVEPDPPEGVEPLRWLLLTTVAVRTLAEAVQMLEDYTRRWSIERLHYTLKSGLKAESLQIDDAHSLAHCLATYYIVAWRLLYATQQARETPAAPPTVVFTPLEVQVLETVSGKKVTTLEIAVREIAKLGGYEHYQNKKLPPGVKVMWWGLQRLDALVSGWQAALQSLQTTEK
jgi:hypothetical protein